MGLFFLLLSLLLSATPATAAPEKPTEKAPIVFVDTLKKADLYDVLTFPARLVPQTSATLLAEVEGVVKRVHASLGREVKRGTVILTLVNTDPIYQYAPLAVRSPVDGVVSSIEVTDGTRVIRSQKLGTVTDPKRVKITVEVAAADLSALANGLAGELAIPSAEAPIPVVITGISPFVDPATGTATVELKAVSKKAALPPGLIGRVSFRVRDHQGFQVPEGSIVYRGQNPGIRIVEGGKAKYVPVTLGATRRGLVEVVKGVPENAQVVIRASAYVGDGETVTIEKSEGPSS